jgi:F-type H+-transporting ATPase subunit epsilon
MKLEIVTPDHAYPARDIRSLDVPAHDGRLTVLPGHEPMVCLLQPGTVSISTDAAAESWTIGEGTLSVSADQLTILATRAAQTPG